MRVSKDPVTGHLVMVPSPTCMKEIGEVRCGHCTYILSGKELFLGEKETARLNGKPWSKVKRESVIVPATESYAPIAAYMINACKKMGCNDDVERFKVRLDKLDTVKKE